jgi:hypothetical protein
VALVEPHQQLRALLLVLVVAAVRVAQLSIIFLRLLFPDLLQ